MQKILVPTDFSELSLNAIRVGMQIARKAEASLIVVHIINLPESLNKEDRASQEGKLRKVIQERFNEIGDISENDVNVEEIVQFGPIYDTITSIVKERGIDLIVMGSNGNRGNRFFAGSNTQKVVRLSNTPVLTIKSKQTQFDLKKIVFASNFFGEVNKSFSPILEMARLYKVDIELVKVVTPSNFENTGYSEKLMKDFAEEQGLENYSMNIYNHKELGKGILEFTEKVNADLIAINTHGRKGISHLLSGSIAENIVNTSQACILSVRLAEEPKSDNILFPE